MNGTNGKDGAAGKDADPTAITNLQQQITVLQQQVQSMTVTINNLTQQAANPKPEAPWAVYFTSGGYKADAPTDALARQLLASNKRISIVTLDPTGINEANIKDVPRVQVIPTKQQIAGIDDVTAFLNQFGGLPATARRHPKKIVE